MSTEVPIISPELVLLTAGQQATTKSRSSKARRTARRGRRATESQALIDAVMAR